MNQFENKPVKSGQDARFWHYAWCGYHAGGDTHRMCPICEIPDWNETKEAAKQPMLFK